MSSFDEHHHSDEPGDTDHVAGLLALRAVIGLDDDEVRTLQTGLAQGMADGSVSPDDLDAFDELAARATIGLLPLHDDTPPMPSSLRERLVADCVRVAHGRPADASSSADVVRRDPERADAFMESVEAADAPAPLPMTPSAEPSATATTDRPAPRPADGDRSRPGVLATLGPWLGWAAAAAAIAFAVLPTVTDPGVDAEPLTAERLTASADDVVEIQLAGLENVAPGVTGRILWSESQQAGVLRVSGLQANDPDDMQYQLWVFDRGREARSEQFSAVDGGVFDVPSDAGEIEIPIDAKLPVFEPYLFAITSEPPGGVVKHDPALDPDRYRIVAAAALEG